MTVFRFDEVEVDTEAFQARRAGVPVPLEPKALEVLLFLVHSHGRLVTKAELLQAVWPGTFVTESALTRLVAQLRKGLGDDVHEARYIETVPTRGYRFVGRMNGSTAVLAPAPDPHEAPPSVLGADRLPRRSKAWMTTGALGVATGVVLAARLQRLSRVLAGRKQPGLRFRPDGGARDLDSTPGPGRAGDTGDSRRSEQP
jgi:DNA-binding winged helix-turn-helix (wHTH) protein